MFGTNHALKSDLVVPSLCVEHLSVSIENKPILDDINLRFNSGEFVAVLGPNGTGKSTLLKAITGEIKHSGQCTVFNKPKNSWQPQKLAKHLGVLPQSSSLTFNFTAQEVVKLGGLGLSAHHFELNHIACRYMIKTDTLHLADRLYPSLSGGEKQRVHLARVLTQLDQSGDQKIVILDEPTAALDIHHQHSTLKLAKELTHQGATVIAVLHDLNLASQYADRIVMLNKGEVVVDDEPSKALQPHFIESVYHYPANVIVHPKLGHPLVIAG